MLLGSRAFIKILPKLVQIDFESKWKVIRSKLEVLEQMFLKETQKAEEPVQWLNGQLCLMAFSSIQNAALNLSIHVSLFLSRLGQIVSISKSLKYSLGQV